MEESAVVARKKKWAPPPRILHLTRRSRRRKQPTKNVASKSNFDSDPVHRMSPNGELFDQQRSFAYWVPPLAGPREKVVERRHCDGGGGGGGKERWRFEVEMLRAECKCLRMEKEIAVKRLEKESGLMERTIRGSIHSLISGKKKIREGESVNEVLEEGIKGLARRLVELKKCSNLRRDFEIRSCNNFDKRAFMLQRKLEKLDALDDAKSLGEKDLAGSRKCADYSRSGFPKAISSAEKGGNLDQVETLRRKVDCSSKGMLLNKMEKEYGKILSTTANASAASSASAKLRDDPDSPSGSVQQRRQEPKPGGLSCSGHCKVILKKILEQVRIETELWTQVQEMLGLVREEMEELQASRDFWKKQTLASDTELRSLRSTVEEWKKRTLSLQEERNKLQKLLKVLQGEFMMLMMERGHGGSKTKDLTPTSWQANLAQDDVENRALICRIKGSSRPSENRHENIDDSGDQNEYMKYSCSRLLSLSGVPLRDIRNLSPLASLNGI
ncbi:hypothetical protein Droror1_Dr00001612 [Drosera rotundifolia]